MKTQYQLNYKNEKMFPVVHFEMPAEAGMNLHQCVWLASPDVW
jgi:hypothetical protein